MIFFYKKQRVLWQDLVIDGCGLHFNRVVSVPQLGESEAPHLLQVVDAVQKVVVSLRSQAQNRPAKQVKLDGHLGAHGWVHSGLATNSIFFCFLFVKND